MPTACSPLGGPFCPHKKKDWIPLEIWKLWKKSQKWVEAEPSTQSSFLKKYLVLVVKNCTETDIKASRSVQFLLDFLFKSSRPEVFCKKVVLRNFAKFTGKNLCLRPATLLKKRLWQRCFPVKFAKFLRTHFFYRTTPVAASAYYCFINFVPNCMFWNCLKLIQIFYFVNWVLH